MNARRKFRLLRRLADALCLQHGLPPVSDRLLWENCAASCPQPIVLRARGARIWLDRRYAAECFRDAAPRYVYITYAHIYEEMHGYALASRLRGQPCALPAEIHEQFRAALKCMRAEGANFWLSEELLPSVLPECV